VCQNFVKSGFGNRWDKLLDTATAEIAIRENPEEEEERSSLTVFRFRGFERPTLELRIRESAKSDLLSAKRGSHENLLWVQIF
jgi:hypothetical protein